MSKAAEESSRMMTEDKEAVLEVPVSRQGGQSPFSGLP